MTSKSSFYDLTKTVDLVGGPHDGHLVVIKVERVKPVTVQGHAYIPWRINGGIVWAHDEMSHHQIVDKLTRPRT